MLLQVICVNRPCNTYMSQSCSTLRSKRRFAIPQTHPGCFAGCRRTMCFASQYCCLICRLASAIGSPCQYAAVLLGLIDAPFAMWQLWLSSRSRQPCQHRRHLLPLAFRLLLIRQTTYSSTLQAEHRAMAFVSTTRHARCYCLFAAIWPAGSCQGVGSPEHPLQCDRIRHD